MSTQTVTLELSESLYRSAIQVAQATKRPLTDILQEGIKHILPPLDDVSQAEAVELAQLSTLTDAELWHVSAVLLPATEQNELQDLLDHQREGHLLPVDQVRLQTLLDEYGRLLVQKAHAWLLLARRGYRVPIQSN
jgi:hypothetical protein